MWIIVAAFMAGVLLGGAISKWIFRPSVAGVVRVDQSDPDSDPYLFLELEKDIESSIMEKKYVTFKINVKDYISHK